MYLIFLIATIFILACIATVLYFVEKCVQKQITKQTELRDEAKKDEYDRRGCYDIMECRILDRYFKLQEEGSPEAEHFCKAMLKYFRDYHIDLIVNPPESDKIPTQIPLDVFQNNVRLFKSRYMSQEVRNASPYKEIIDEFESERNRNQSICKEAV